jgi:hypothetical protein
MNVNCMRKDGAMALFERESDARDAGFDLILSKAEAFELLRLYREERRKRLIELKKGAKLREKTELEKWVRVAEDANIDPTPDGMRGYLGHLNRLIKDLT